MCTDSAEQPRIYRITHIALKIRSTPTDGKAIAQMEEWIPELVNDHFWAPSVLNENSNPVVDNSAHTSSSGDPEPPLPTLDLSIFSQERGKMISMQRQPVQLLLH